MWRKRALFHCWQECRLVQPLWITVWWSLKKLRIKLSYDPAVPFLGIYLKNSKTHICRDICTPMLTAASLAVAKTWRPPKCPAVDDWNKEGLVIHTTKYYSAIRKDKILPFATTGMDFENTMLSKLSPQKLRTMWFHSCGGCGTGAGGHRQQYGGYQRGWGFGRG